jgi:peptidyl-prolyl cis-trans isomerase D
VRLFDARFIFPDDSFQMKRTSLLVLALSATTLAACDGLSEAFSAHTDVVAKAGPNELSVTRLGELLGKAKLGLPVNKEVATLITRDLWVPYQLLGVAAAHGDSLSDPKAIDAAAAGMLENARLGRFMESVAAKLPVDTGSEASYLAAKGGLYSARHILFMFPADAKPAQKDSVRKKAESVRLQVTPANFADLAKKYSGDATAQKGGDLGVFPLGIMVKPFGDALAKLKPGEISPLVETQFGYHIVQRNTWAQAKNEYAAQAGGRGRQVAESTYIAGLQATANIQLKSDAATTMKEIAKDPLAMRDSKTVIATYKGGELTAGRLALVLLSSPQSARLSQQITGAPDSLVVQYVKNMAQRDVLLQKADSQKVAVTPEELASLHRDFVQAVVQSWGAMNLDPKSLADSGKTVEAREKIAAGRVEAFLDRIMAGGVQPLPIPSPLQIVLMNKYPSKSNAAGIDRAVELAAKLRVATDSAKAASQPKSAVPLPLPDAGAPKAAPVPPAKKP